VDVLSPIRGEYLRYRRLVELAIEQVGDADLDRRLAAGGNSIAITIAHLTGNLRSRFTDFLTSDGEKPWRQRDREFEDPRRGRAELLADWAAAWEIADRAIAEVAALPPVDLGREITIRGQPLTVLEALHRSVAHVAYHAGQVVLLARTFAGDAWRSLSIPRGGSAAYAAEPRRERGPDGGAQTR
jgi:hypothetical protein